MSRLAVGWSAALGGLHVTSALYRLGRWCAHRPWRVIAVWMLAAAAVLAAGARWGAASSESIEIPGTESQRAIDLLEERYPDAAGGRARVVFATDAGRVTDPQFRSGAQGTLDQIRALPRVRQVIDPFGPAGGFLVSPDGRIAFAEIVYAVTAREVGVDGVDALTATAGPARDAGLDVAFGGPVVERIGPDDTHASELIGLAVAVIVLAVAFGSVTAMALPMCTSLVGLGVGLALMRLLGGFVEVTSVAPILGSMIGIAVGIDYSLFIVTRHRQQLAQGYELDESVARALATSGQAVVFAGVTVMIAILGLALIGIPLVAALGYAVSLMVAIAVLVAITLLPALLGLVGTRIDRPPRPWRATALRERPPHLPVHLGPMGPPRHPPTLAVPRSRAPCSSSHWRFPRPASSWAGPTPATCPLTPPPATRMTCSPRASVKGSTGPC
jgi:RND superfamily putative drug exporter